MTVRWWRGERLCLAIVVVGERHRRGDADGERPTLALLPDVPWKGEE